jgi:hypothetical protein
MPKVVTSEGLTEFVQSGKHEKIAPLKAGEAPKLETVKDTPTLEIGSPDKNGADKSPVASPTAVSSEAGIEHDEALTAEEQALPEKARKEIQRSKRAVNEKHKAMKEAQEAAESADRLAEQQYNERRLAEQRAEKAEARARELEAKTNPPPPLEAKEPDVKDYQDAQGNIDWVKFQKDTSKYAAEQAIKDYRKSQADHDAALEREARIKVMQASANEVRKAHPDFDQVMNALQGTDEDKVPNFVLSFIEASENSANVAYHLAKNREVREKISSMKPILGIAELGKLEASLVKPPSQAATVPAAQSVTPVRTNGGAPAPITPLDGEGSAGINTDPSKMSYKELRAYHKAKEAEKRRH